MDYHCEIKDLPEQPILSIRTHSSMISLPKALGKAFEKLEARLKELGGGACRGTFRCLLQ